MNLDFPKTAPKNIEGFEVIKNTPKKQIKLRRIYKNKKRLSPP